MKIQILFQIVLCVVSKHIANALTSEEVSEVTETCCMHGEAFAVISSSAQQCSGAGPPEEIEADQMDTCRAALTSCCEEHLERKDQCAAGMKLAPDKRCSVPKTDIGVNCCEECSIGMWTGESQGKEACGQPPGDDVSPISALRKNAYHQCCLEAANKPDTTTEKRIETTTEKKVTTTKKPKERCKQDSCEHLCNDDSGKVTCQCNEGYRLQSDKKSCKDINECAEAIDDLCTVEGTVCHNTPGAFKCVPIKKRDVGLTCPPGFKRDVVNQVCDDINECQLPRPPCAKYLCVNTIGGYKCGGKPGKPFEEAIPGVTTEPSPSSTPSKNDICPPGFRSGPDDECIDIDECEERVDDCQRLSQYCINDHGSFFCQDHVSKRCAPGFKVNAGTGVCEDIDECEESTELCRRSEVCVNRPGAYTCKSKISTLPQLAKKTCKEGTRIKAGGNVCEDIDECREGTHLCDQFQNCINTYGGHECRCKNGYELDSSGSCVDIDECTLKLDNCEPGAYCNNILGSYTCSRRAPTTSTTVAYEYDYDEEEDNSTNSNETIPPTTSTTTRRPTAPRRPPTRPTPPPTRPTPPPTRPTTIPTTTSTTTTPVPPPTPPLPPYPSEDFPTTSTTRRPYTNRPRPRPTPARRPEEPTTPRPSPPARRPEEPVTPRPTPPTSRPELPVTPRPPPPTRRPDPEPPVEVTLPAPKDPVTIEKERDPEGAYHIDTDEIPKDRWTSVTGKDSEKPDDDFDSKLLHCLNGYERNSTGICVDVDECEEKRHVCSILEQCQNEPGGYSCNCIAGYYRDDIGRCAVITTSSTTTTVRPTTTTESNNDVSKPDWSYTPGARQRPPVPPTNCEWGYTFNSNQGSCVDIDECATDKAKCSATEDCVNIPGGYRCVCGRRCRTEANVPNTEVRPRPPPSHNNNVITVGAQYGQRGPRNMRPTYTRNYNGDTVTKCPWGYKLASDRCIDIDECAKNISECGADQRCENFHGGYSCQCPAGHKLAGQEGCEDIDECTYGQPCPYNSQCINTVGSFRCSCGDGFRNAPSNEKVCVDIDECSESPHVCEQGCANAWGSYRCYCEKGYRLTNDNRTCEDVDECAEWSAVRHRGRLCGGECVNEAGSYRCACPQGYRLAEDARSCIDVDECESGEATCARAAAGEVCQNTRGSYHCYQIDCPRGYRLEDKHRCSRIQRSCPVSDWNCIHQPSTYSYNFITFVANIYLPEGSVDLFTMHGPGWRDATITFDLQMVSAQAMPGVQPATRSCFDMRPMRNVCRIALLCSLGGPQVVELELTMSLYQRDQFAGSAVARLVVIVSQYEF